MRLEFGRSQESTEIPNVVKKGNFNRIAKSFGIPLTANVGIALSLLEPVSETPSVEGTAAIIAVVNLVALGIGFASYRRSGSTERSVVKQEDSLQSSQQLIESQASRISSQKE